MQLISLRELRDTYLVVEDTIRNNQVEFWGCGWYSLDADGIFRKGRAATNCRIRIAPWRLIDRVPANRIREARRNKAERIQRDIRHNMFTYQSNGKADKAYQILGRCRKLLEPRFAARNHSAFVAALHAAAMGLR